MDPVQDLLNRLAELGPDELASRIADLEPEQLVAFNDALLDQLNAAAEAERTVETVATMARCRDGLVAARAENARRTEAQAALDAEADRILAEATAPEPVAEEPATEGDPADPPADPAEQPAAPDGGDPAAAAPTDAPAEQPAEPVAASAPPQFRRPAPTDAFARHRPARHDPRPAEEPTAPFVITAAGDLPGLSAGQPITTDQVLSGMIAKERATREIAGGRWVVASLRHGDRYPEERRLTQGADKANMAKIDAVVAALRTGEESLTASGGLCAPVAPDYSQVMPSVADRPIRDSLVQFAATRGGIRFIRPAVLSDVAGAVGIWTEATDANPGNATKNVLRVTCGDEVEVVVDAITFALEIGNFMERTFRERVDEFMGYTMANWARVAENNLLSGMDAAGQAVDAAQLLGASRDTLATISRAAARLRWRHRMNPEATVYTWFPAWARELFRTDLARQAPGDGGDRMSISNAQIDAWFSVRNVNVTWHLDDAAPNWDDAAKAGQLSPWPEDLVFRIATDPFTFLDGGILDLGIYRDSTLNSQNNLRTFGESFEAVAFRGVEAQTVTIQHICANGQAADLVDTTAECLSGS